MAKEKFGSASLDIEGHVIQIADIEIETFAAGGNGRERSIIAFRAPAYLPQRVEEKSGRRAKTHVITTSYSIPTPDILPEENIFERIVTIKDSIRQHLQKVYGK